MVLFSWSLRLSGQLHSLSFSVPPISSYKPLRRHLYTQSSMTGEISKSRRSNPDQKGLSSRHLLRVNQE